MILSDCSRLANAISKRKDQLLLYAIGAWRKRSKRYEEIWKLSTIAQLPLEVEQALQGHLFRYSVFKTEMIRADVDAGTSSEIVVSNLRYQRIRALY